MARKAPVQDLLPANLNTEALTSANSALSLQGEQASRLMQAYNVTHANPDALEAEIRGFQQTAVESMFAIGARLIVMRAVVDHGGWLKRLERINMAPRAAQRVMQATMRFADPSKPRDKLLQIGQGKLIELLTLDDEQLDTLDAGGELLELDLDDVARMSTSELRQKLREARAAVEAKDRILADKNTQIDALDEQVNRKFKPRRESIAKTQAEAEALNGLVDAINGVDVHFAKLANVATELMEAGQREAVRERVQHGVQYLVSRLRDVVLEYQLGVNVEGEALGGRPAWLDETN